MTKVSKVDTIRLQGLFIGRSLCKCCGAELVSQAGRPLVLKIDFLIRINPKSVLGSCKDAKIALLLQHALKLYYGLREDQHIL